MFHILLLKKNILDKNPNASIGLSCSINFVVVVSTNQNLIIQILHTWYSFVTDNLSQIIIYLRLHALPLVKILLYMITHEINFYPTPQFDKHIRYKCIFPS